MACILGLKVREAHQGDCGNYSVPGTGQSNCYAGVVDEDVVLQLAPSVKFGVAGLNLINHPHPLVLVRSGLLLGGRAAELCNYTGMRLETGAEGIVRGHIYFDKGSESIEEPLVNVPTAQGSHLAGTRTVGFVGGQCVRHCSRLNLGENARGGRGARATGRSEHGG